MGELDAPVVRRASLARAHRLVVERGRQQPSLQPIALPVLGAPSGRGMAKQRPRPEAIVVAAARLPPARVGRRGPGSSRWARSIEHEPAPGLQRARDAGEEARELPIGGEMLDGVKRGDREQEAARDREAREISAQQQRAAADARGRPAEPRRRARASIGGRAIDADDGMTGAQQRQHEPAGAAAEVEDRTTALVSQRAVEGTSSRRRRYSQSYSAASSNGSPGRMPG